MSTRRKKATKVALAIPVSLPASSSATVAVVRKRRRRRARGVGGGQMLGMYLRSLADPFHATPPKLGFGTLAPTSTYTGWQRFTATTAYANFAVVCCPSTLGSASVGSGTSFLRVYGYSNAGTAIGNSATAGGYLSNQTAQNWAALQNLSETSRCITAGLRLQAPMPGTGAPGQLYAGLMHDSIGNIENLSFNALSNLANLQPVPLDSSRQCVTEIHFRPFDYSDYGFVNSSSTPQTFGATFMVMVGVGWGAGSALPLPHIDAITHVESVGGVLASADDIDSAVLSDSVSQDSIRPLISQLPIVISGMAVEQKDGVFQRLSRSQQLARAGPSHTVPASRTAIYESVAPPPESGFVEVMTGAIPSVLATTGAALLMNRAEQQLRRVG